MNVVQTRDNLLAARKEQEIWLGLAPAPRGFGRWLATQSEIDQIKKDWGSLQQYLDEFSPLPTFRVLMDRTPLPFFDTMRFAALARGNMGLSFSVALATGLLIWPWIAALAMMLLRTTMRQASVRRIHLLRVTIYCGDIVLWLILLESGPLLMKLIERTQLSQWGPVMYNVIFGSWQLFTYGPIVLALLLTYRFDVAIKQYLHFRHAIGVAISVQVIFLLLVLQMMSWICA
jgi:hypothetical protein